MHLDTAAEWLPRACELRSSCAQHGDWAPRQLRRCRHLQLKRTRGSTAAKKTQPTARMRTTATATYSGPPCFMPQSSVASRASSACSSLHGAGQVVSGAILTSLRGVNGGRSIRQSCGSSPECRSSCGVCDKPVSSSLDPSLEF